MPASKHCLRPRPTGAVVTTVSADTSSAIPDACVLVVLKVPTVEVAGCEPGVIDPDLRLGGMALVCLLSWGSEVAYVGGICAAWRW